MITFTMRQRAGQLVLNGIMVHLDMNDMEIYVQWISNDARDDSWRTASSHYQSRSYNVLNR